ncbi:type IV pilin protein [Alicyclobacillus hesperidum]|uniref:type IV pilin protein n=1 Tax=Alicyclobacillus hesperidum TaxID=89784 RepID=UPI0024902A71|nr:prepilin-type N-terminal cleavage/methylation domain-containing protein [Alicyclobacillus hesperidum]
MQALKDKLQNLLKKLKEQQGVTLIELLAVVVILAILAAVGVPVVMGQINKARVATDKANEQMIADALQRAEFDYQSNSANGGALAINSTGNLTSSPGGATLAPANSAANGSSFVSDLLTNGLNNSTGGGYINSLPAPQSQKGSFAIVNAQPPANSTVPYVTFTYPNSTNGTTGTYYVTIQ